MTLSAFAAMRIKLGTFRNKLVAGWLKDRMVDGSFK